MACSGDASARLPLRRRCCCSLQRGGRGAGAAEETESAGLRVGCALSALTSDRPAAAGREAAFAFTLTTGKNDAPLRGARPAAWLVPHVAGERLDERQCRRIAAT